MKSDAERSLIRKRGVVVSFLPRKGYGFIKGEADEQLFVHFSDIRGEGHKVLEVGEEVEYTRTESDRGAQARDVARLAPPISQNFENNPNEGHRKW